MKKAYIIRGREPIDDYDWVVKTIFLSKDRAELAKKELEDDQTDEDGYYSGYYFTIDEVELNECE